MFAVRAAGPLRASAMRTPVVFARTYVPDVRSEGATASSKGFDKREQAEEGQYIRKREQEKLAKLKEQLAKTHAEIEEQQKVVDSHSK